MCSSSTELRFSLLFPVNHARSHMNAKMVLFEENLVMLQVYAVTQHTPWYKMANETPVSHSPWLWTCLSTFQAVYLRKRWQQNICEFDRARFLNFLADIRCLHATNPLYSASDCEQHGTGVPQSHFLLESSCCSQSTIAWQNPAKCCNT